MNDFKSDLHLDPTHVWELEAAKKQYNDDEQRAVAKQNIYRHLAGSVQGYEDMIPYESRSYRRAVKRLRKAVDKMNPHVQGEGKAD